MGALPPPACSPAHRHRRSRSSTRRRSGASCARRPGPGSPRGRRPGGTAPAPESGARATPTGFTLRRNGACASRGPPGRRPAPRPAPNLELHELDALGVGAAHRCHEAALAAPTCSAAPAGAAGRSGAGPQRGQPRRQAARIRRAPGRQQVLQLVRVALEVVQLDLAVRVLDVLPAVVAQPCEGQALACRPRAAARGPTGRPGRRPARAASGRPRPAGAASAASRIVGARSALVTSCARRRRAARPVRASAAASGSRARTASTCPWAPGARREEAVVAREQDQGVVELAGRAQRVDDRARRRRRPPAATRAAAGRPPDAPRARGDLSAGRACMASGLSDMSASLKEARLGSGERGERVHVPGATAGVGDAGGSSASRGPPLCGARKATDRKKGCGDGAAAAISSLARRAKKSVE